MTGQSVSIIITLVVGQERQEIQRSIEPERLEETIREFSQEIGQALLQTALDVLDGSLRAEVPKGWRNVGTASRTVVFESGPVKYRRRVYQDEHGRRWKPLDLLLGIAPFARTSLKVQEMGCVLASRSTYRNASEMLAYVLRTAISPSSLQRMVKRFGELIEAYEQDWRAETEPGRIQTDTLYGESDGVWVHLQQQDQKRAEVKVGLLYSGKKCIGMGRYACENKVVMTQLGGSNEEWQIKVRELADRHLGFDPVEIFGNIDISQFKPPSFLVSIEDRFGETAGLEKRETQQHSIGGNLEDTGMDVFGEHYALHQNCIDCHADHHEETLKAQRDQIADVIVTGLSPFPVGQRSKGDRRNRAGQEDFDHASIQDHRDQH